MNRSYLLKTRKLVREHERVKQKLERIETEIRRRSKKIRCVQIASTYEETCKARGYPCDVAGINCVLTSLEYK